MCADELIRTSTGADDGAKCAWISFIDRTLHCNCRVTANSQLMGHIDLSNIGRFAGYYIKSSYIISP